MAVKVLENKVKYLNRCRCGALLEFERDDIRFSEICPEMVQTDDDIKAMENVFRKRLEK